MKTFATTFLYVFLTAVYLSSPAPSYVADKVTSLFHSIRCTVTTCASPVAIKVKKK